MANWNYFASSRPGAGKCGKSRQKAAHSRQVNAKLAAMLRSLSRRKRLIYYAQDSTCEPEIWAGPHSMEDMSRVWLACGPLPGEWAL